MTKLRILAASARPLADVLIDALRASSKLSRLRASFPSEDDQARQQYSLQLEEESDSLAAALVAIGVRPGDRLALCLPNCPQFMVGEYAAWKAGAIVCPFNPNYSDREMGEALRTTGAETLVVLNRFYERVKGIQSTTSLKRIVATNIKEYLPPLLRIAYTFLKEKKEGDRISLRAGDYRFTDLLRGFRRVPRPDVPVSPDDPGSTVGTLRTTCKNSRKSVV